jgi:putative oxidoreductase
MTVAEASQPSAPAWTSWVWLVLRLALAALFLYAGASKLADPTAFAVEIDHYQLMPWLAPYLAAGLPALEITLGVALVVLPAPWRRAAALGCLALMVAFTVAAAWALVRKLDIDCGCFGKGSGPITWLTMLRDAALIAACAVLVRKA